MAEGREESIQPARAKAAGAMLILLIIAIAAAILAPIVTQLLYFALSRRREYLATRVGSADAIPGRLANALEKIANDNAPQLAYANKVTAPMFIVNPFKKMGQWNFSDMTSTHPPI